MKISIRSPAKTTTTQAPAKSSSPSTRVSPVGYLAELAAMANRSPKVSQLRALQELANRSPQVRRLRALQEMANRSPRVQAQPKLRDEINNSSPPNRTGLPDQLKSGVESLSGISLHDVKVHYNSAKPAQLNAMAYAQGTDIHVAPGQEKHLPHEAWHIVQQAQGRVQPTMQMKGDVSINDDAGLEREADVMGEKSLAASEIVPHDETQNVARPSRQAPAQRKIFVGDDPAVMETNNTALVGDKTVTLEGKGAEWVKDLYKRRYKTLEEFQSHMQGTPVHFGLAKKLGRWYTLSYLLNKKFFVLGEVHQAFGYRELIQESNQQDGKVLGEGGSNPILSGSALQTNPEGLSNKRESTMENAAAKAYYCLAVLDATYSKPKNGSGPKVPRKEYRPEEDWLREYQNLPPGKRNTEKNTRLPYFLGRSDEMVYGTFGTKAEDYDRTGTALTLIKTFHKALNEYKGNQYPRASGKTVSIVELKRQITELVAFLELPVPQPGTDDANKHDGKRLKLIKAPFPNVEALAYIEAGLLSSGDLERRLDAVESSNIKSYPEPAKKAFALRDLAMLKSVLKAAKEGDYIMAGMGDTHARNLESELKAKDIPVVLFNDFIDKYSVDAIAPLGSDEEKRVREAEGKLILRSSLTTHAHQQRVSNQTVGSSTQAAVSSLPKVVAILALLTGATLATLLRWLYL